MKKYRKPLIRKVVLEEEVVILAGSGKLFNYGMRTTGEQMGIASDQEDLSKGNDGWDCWDED